MKKLKKTKAEIALLMLNRCSSEYEYDRENTMYYLLKNNLEAIMKYQFKVVELTRIKNMIECNLPILDYTSKLNIMLDGYKNDLLNYTLMKSTTSIIHNLASVWESEVKQELIKYYQFIMK